MTRPLRTPAMSNQRGSSLVEFAVLLPLLLILVFGAIDLGRAIQFNNILVNMSREGANLAARTQISPQAIIDALNHTAAPIAMETDGMIYLTRITGTKLNPACTTNCVVEARVRAQYRATVGGAISSRIYTCPGWSGATCSVPNPLPEIEWDMALTDAEEVWVAEVACNYAPVTGFALIGKRQLYSRTVL